jgi:hypothetical protein
VYHFINPFLQLQIHIPSTRVISTAIPDHRAKSTNTMMGFMSKSVSACDFATYLSEDEEKLPTLVRKCEDVANNLW